MNIGPFSSSILFLILFVLQITHYNRINCGLTDILNPVPLVPITTTSTSELVKQAGYEPTVHNVKTQPGYVINLIRIANPAIKSSHLKKRRTVLFVHGVLENANQWVLMGVKGGKPHDWTNLNPNNASQDDIKELIGNDLTSRSLPFLLANFGFDCWLMNRRNTKQSRSVSDNFDISSDDNKIIKKMTKLQIDDKSIISDILDNFSNLLPNNTITPGNKYYNFSHDEQSRYDIPIVLDYILEVSGATKLDYIGHATGCLVALQALARQPELGSQSMYNFD